MPISPNAKNRTVIAKVDLTQGELDSLRSMAEIDGNTVAAEIRLALRLLLSTRLGHDLPDGGEFDGS